MTEISGKGLGGSDNFMTPLPVDGQKTWLPTAAPEQVTLLPVEKEYKGMTLHPVSQQTIHNDSIQPQNESIYTGIMAQQRHLYDADGETYAPFEYLEEEQNLKFPKISVDVTSSDKPVSTMQAIGHWVKAVLDPRTYWNAGEKMGTDVAKYRWAYKEGTLGEFNLWDFSKEMGKSGVRTTAGESIRMVGNLIYVFGSGLEQPDVLRNNLPQLGGGLKKIGLLFNEYAEDIENSSFLAPSPEVYERDPNWLSLGNALGSNSSQVLMMGGLSKILNGKKTYGLFAVSDANEVFKESYEKDGDFSKATSLAMLSGSSSYAIDRILNPLPKQLESRAQMTSKLIRREFFISPLSEGSSEILQQLLSENLVRKVGIDDAIDLFDGLVESALGAFTGTVALMGADGTVYHTHKTYNDVRKKLMLKGVTAEEIEMFKAKSLELMKKNPDAFSKILQYGLDENLEKIKKAAKQAHDEKAAKQAEAAATGLQKIHNDIYQRSFKATGDEGKARLAANMMEANMLVLQDAGLGFSLDSILKDRLPEYRQVPYQEAKQKLLPKPSVMFQFGGENARFPDFENLKKAAELERGKSTKSNIWLRTGWYHGSDGKWRFEISDADAKLKLHTDIKAEELPTNYWHSYIQKLENMEIEEIKALDNFEKFSLHRGNERAEWRYDQMYNDFIDFLDKNFERHMVFGRNSKGSWELRDLDKELEEAVKQRHTEAEIQLHSLTDGYERQQKALQEMLLTEKDTVLFKEETLKELLKKRKKLNEPVVEDLLTANQNTSDTKNFSNQSEEGESGNSADSSRQIQQQIRESDKENAGTDTFSQKIETDDTKVKSEKEKYYKEISSTDFLKGKQEDVLVSVKSSDIKKGTEVEFKTEMEKLLNSYRNKKVYNPSLDANIEIRTASIKKYKSFSDDNNKKLLVPYLPLLLGTAKFSARQIPNTNQKEPNVRAYYKAYFPVTVDNKLINSRITVKEDDKGNLFWDLRLENTLKKNSPVPEEITSFDDYMQKRKSRKKTVSPERTVIISNDNIQNPDRFYTPEQLKIIKSSLEETRYLSFLDDIWIHRDSPRKNIAEMENFLNWHGAKSQGNEYTLTILNPATGEITFSNEKYTENEKWKQAATDRKNKRKAKFSQDFYRTGLKEIPARKKQRQETIQRLGLKDSPELYDDIQRELAYRTYLAGSGDFHKPYQNMTYRPDFYRQAYLPTLMSEKFFAQEQYRYLLPSQKIFYSNALNKLHQIYRIHREIDFAHKAELRDIQAANAFIAEHQTDGDESLRRYWLERQLLLDKKEVKLGELLEHPELYRQYPELSDVVVRFAELDNDDGYHFYHDEEIRNDVLEIAPEKFDYSNLKDILLQGAAFSIQMKEGFDLGMAPEQRRNFMNRHIYLAKMQYAPEAKKKLDAFLKLYLPEEKTMNFLMDKEVPLPLLNLYKSEALKQPGQPENGNETQKAVYQEIDFDRLYDKLHEKYGDRIFDYDERQLGDFAYSALQDLRNDIQDSITKKARESSGYNFTMPYPWAGINSYGNMETRAVLQRQDYADWQRKFSFWDDRAVSAPTLKTRLTYNDIIKENSPLFVKQETAKTLPDNEILSPQKQLNSVMDDLAKGAYDAADRTIYLFEKADAETIVHETFHYLNQILKEADMHGNIELKRAYDEMIESYRNMVLRSRKLVKVHGQYILVSPNDIRSVLSIPRRFNSPAEALNAEIEELLVRRFMRIMSGQMDVGQGIERPIYDFYTIWMNKLVSGLDTDKIKIGAGGSKIINAVKKIKLKTENGLRKYFIPQK